MRVFPTIGEGFIYLQYSGDLMDTVRSLDANVLMPKFTNYIHFTAGTANLIVGARAIGGTSSATATIASVVVTSGTLAGGDAAGIAFLKNITGTWALGENITISGPTTIGVARSTVLEVPMVQAKAAFLQCETNSIRVCWSGYTPTNSAATPASQGVLMVDTNSFDIVGEMNLRNLKFVNAVSTSNGVMNVVLCY